jgi:hypothetical protein
MDVGLCLGTPERSAVVQWDVLSTYFDVYGLCHDQGIKREAKLKELRQCGVFCQKWYPWLISAEANELAELESRVEATERSNMCENDVAAPA